MNDAAGRRMGRFGQYGRRFDDDAQLFHTFTADAFRQGLALLLLAAGKLPQQPVAFSSGTLTKEKTRAAADDGGSDFQHAIPPIIKTESD